MTNLKENIDHYMNRKGIRYYSDLLIDIAHQLNIKGEDAYQFAIRERSNFSKMLKGERPLKYEFIIPLEKILGVSLAKLLEKDAYKIPADKNEVPFVKNFRYYAYVDDYDLYEKELDLFLTKSSRSCLSCSDEFEKTFLDYVVEYGSKNAVRFLRDKYKIKMTYSNNEFQSSLPNSFYIFTHNGIEFARLVASINDAKLFSDIYDSYLMLASNGFYTSNTIWVQDEFLEIILDNNVIFNSLFERKKYTYKYGQKAMKKLGKDSMIFYSINPLINLCLKHALNNLEKYRNQAIEILDYGISHNKRIIDGLEIDLNYIVADELGGLRNWNDKSNEIIDVAIIAKVLDIHDKEINSLIKKLPKFNKLL